MRIEYTLPNGTTRTFSFPLPPKELEIEQIKPKESVKESVDGSRQVINYAMPKILPVTFMFLERDFVMDNLLPFYVEHAMFNRSFKWFADNETLVFQTYRLDNRNFMPTRNLETPNLYDFTLYLRRL